MAESGFRRFLGLPARKPEPEPAKLTELVAEKPETPPTTPSRLVAQSDAVDDAAPISPASPDKTAAPEISTGEIEKKAQPRRAPLYVWRSQASKDSRASFADYIDTQF